MFADILSGLTLVFQIENILSALFGVIVGVFFGAVPGFTDITAMCLLLPFTLYLNPIASISMLMGLSKGANFGGSIPAILFNVPGTPQATVTTFDGYPLTKQGKSGKALKMALYASTIADNMSAYILLFFCAPVSLMALKIGPPELSMIILFSLAVIGIVACEDLLLGMVSIGIGLFFALIGSDPQLSTPRFCFGSINLTAGFGLIPMVTGLLIVSEAFIQIEKGFKRESYSKNVVIKNNKLDEETIRRNKTVSFQEFKQCLPSILRGVGIGAAMGIIPGIGTTVASYLSYVQAKRSSKEPERFGKGALEGVAAAEAGNNAVVGPNLIPLITLGIPGNLAAAIILGAFMVQGLVPGPLFMQQHAPMLYALFIIVIISSLFLFLIGSIFLRLVQKLTSIPKDFLYPMIIFFGVVGSYIFQNSLFDVQIMLFLALLGYFFRKLDIPIPSILIAFILGKIFESKIRQTFLISRGSVNILFTHPIALLFLILTIVVIIVYSLRKKPPRAE